MRTKITLLLIITGSWLASCQESLEPVRYVPETTGINFYNASETMAAANITPDVYIDDTTSSKNRLGWMAGTTETPAGQPFGDTGTKNQDYTLPTWLPVSAGLHRFFFSAGYNDVPDTTLTLNGQDLNSFYISDSPASETAYRITAVQEEWGAATATPGKIKIRLINLSPDAGNLSCYRSDNDALIVQGIRGGKASPYILLDSQTGNAQSKDQIILQFYSDLDPDNILINAALPNIPGSTFIILLQGYKEKTDRLVQTAVDPAGAPIYSRQTIKSNVRITLRRIF